jgi:hypothetical protein
MTGAVAFVVAIPWLSMGAVAQHLKRGVLVDEWRSMRMPFVSASRPPKRCKLLSVPLQPTVDKLFRL